MSTGWDFKLSSLQIPWRGNSFDTSLILCRIVSLGDLKFAKITSSCQSLIVRCIMQQSREQVLEQKTVDQHTLTVFHPIYCYYLIHTSIIFYLDMIVNRDEVQKINSIMDRKNRESNVLTTATVRFSRGRQS